MACILTCDADAATILDHGSRKYKFVFGHEEFYHFFDEEGFCKDEELLEKLVLASWADYKDQNFYDDLEV